MAGSGADAPRLDALTAAFPFHLVTNPALQITRIGPGLARLAPDLATGQRLTDHFTLLAPETPLDWQTLVESASVIFTLAHRRTGLEISGRWVLPEPGDTAVFLGNCWLTDATQVAEFAVLPDEHAEGPAPPTAEGPAEAERAVAPHGSLALPIAVTRCLAEARDTHDALLRLTTVMPAALGWRAASLWVADADGRLRVTAGLPVDALPDALPDDLAALAATARATGAPLWRTAAGDGHTTCAVPAHAGAGVTAVITCWTGAPLAETPSLDDALSLVCAQLSAFLARQADRERLQRLSSELSAIFQLSPDGFVAFNEAGRRSYVNPGFTRLTGITRDELEGVGEADFEARLAALLDPAQPPEATPDGGQLVHLARPRPTVLLRSRREARAPDGRLLGHVLYFRDVTRETELARTSNVFLSNAAHELRTPMASIHGFAELLIRHDFPPERQRQVMQTIHDQATRLVDIVNELLDVARFDARAAHDLMLVAQPLLPVVLAATDGLLVRNDPRRVDLCLPTTTPWVRIDRDKLIQAITNVLSNAYKYSPAGGPITLSVHPRRGDTGGWVGIAVRDQGIGMTDAEQARVFERFFRAHPGGPIPGTGLGMSMVKQIIDMHHGTIELSSRPGQGTEIVLWLPEAEAPPSTLPASDTA